MLQFVSAHERPLKNFFFEGLRPNARPNDLLGEGFATKRWQASVDRGHFYVWADKVGTVRDPSGELCVDGNYAPAWTQSACKYKVLGDWPYRLWQAYKLSDAVYEPYMHLCKDGLPARKRNFEVYCAWRDAKEQQQEVEARTKRIRSNPAVYQVFKEVPQAVAWLQHFLVDALRYPLLLVHGPSRCGKTEWVCSLFKKPLKLEVGSLEFFPDGLRALDRKVHDGLVLDDVRDLLFLSNHQEKLQGAYRSGWLSSRFPKDATVRMSWVPPRPHLPSHAPPASRCVPN